MQFCIVINHINLQNKRGRPVAKRLKTRLVHAITCTNVYLYMLFLCSFLYITQFTLSLGSQDSRQIDIHGIFGVSRKGEGRKTLDEYKWRQITKTGFRECKYLEIQAHKYVL